MTQQDLLGDLLPKDQQTGKFTEAPRNPQTSSTKFTPANITPANITPVDFKPTAPAPSTQKFEFTPGVTPVQPQIEIPDITQVGAGSALPDIEIPKFDFIEPIKKSDYNPATEFVGSMIGIGIGKINDIRNERRYIKDFQSNQGISDIAMTHANAFGLPGNTSKDIRTMELSTGAGLKWKENVIKDSSKTLYKTAEALVSYFGDDIQGRLDDVYNDPTTQSELSKIVRDYANVSLETFSKQEIQSILDSYTKSKSSGEKYISSEQIGKKIAEVSSSLEPFVPQKHKEVQDFAYRTVQQNTVNKINTKEYAGQWETEASHLGIMESATQVATKLVKQIAVTQQNIQIVTETDAVIGNEIDKFYSDTIVPQIVEGIDVYQSHIYKGHDIALRETNKYFQDKYGYNYTEVNSAKAFGRLAETTKNEKLKSMINDPWFISKNQQGLSFNEGLSLFSRIVDTRTSYENGEYLGTMRHALGVGAGVGQQSLTVGVGGLGKYSRIIMNKATGGATKTQADFLSDNNMSYLKRLERVDQSENYYFDNIKEGYADNYDSIASIVIIDALGTKGVNHITKLTHARQLNKVRDVITKADKFDDGSGLVGLKYNTTTGQFTAANKGSNMGLVGAGDKVGDIGIVVTGKEFEAVFINGLPQLKQIPVLDFVLHTAVQVGIVDSAAQNLVGGEYDPVVGLAFVGSVLLAQAYKQRTLMSQQQKQIINDLIVRKSLGVDDYKQLYDTLSKKFESSINGYYDTYTISTVPKGGTAGGGVAGGGVPPTPPRSYTDLTPKQQDLWKSAVNSSIDAYIDLIKLQDPSGTVATKEAMRATGRMLLDDIAEYEQSIKEINDGIINIPDSDVSVFPRAITPQIDPEVFSVLVNDSTQGKSYDIRPDPETGMVTLDSYVFERKQADGSITYTVMPRQMAIDGANSRGVDVNTFNPISLHQHIENIDAQKIKALPLMELDIVEEGLESVNNTEYNRIIKDAQELVKEKGKQVPLLQKAIKALPEPQSPYQALNNLVEINKLVKQVATQGLKTPVEVLETMIMPKELPPMADPITPKDYKILTKSEYDSIKVAIDNIKFTQEDNALKNLYYGKEGQAQVGIILHNYYKSLGVPVVPVMELPRRLAGEGRSIVFDKNTGTIFTAISDGDLLSSTNGELKEALTKYVVDKYESGDNIYNSLIDKLRDNDTQTVLDVINNRTKGERTPTSLIDHIFRGPIWDTDADKSFSHILLDMFGDTDSMSTTGLRLNKFKLQQAITEINQNTSQKFWVTPSILEKIPFFGDYKQYPENAGSYILDGLPIGFIAVPGPEDTFRLMPVPFANHSDLVMNEMVAGHNKIYFLNDANDTGDTKILNPRDDGTVTISKKEFYNLTKKPNNSAPIYPYDLYIHKNGKGSLTPEQIQASFNSTKNPETGVIDKEALLRNLSPLKANHIAVQAAVDFVGDMSDSMTHYFLNRNEGYNHILTMQNKGTSRDSMIDWLNEELAENSFNHYTIQTYYDYLDFIDGKKVNTDLYNQFNNWLINNAKNRIDSYYQNTHPTQIFMDVVDFVNSPSNEKLNTYAPGSRSFINKYLPYDFNDEGKLYLKQEAASVLGDILGLDKPNNIYTLKESNILPDKADKIIKTALAKQGNLGTQLLVELLPDIGIDDLYDKIVNGDVVIHTFNNPSEVGKRTQDNFHSKRLPINVPIVRHNITTDQQIRVILKQYGFGDVTTEGNTIKHIFLPEGYASVGFREYANKDLKESGVYFVDNKISGETWLGVENNMLVIKTNNEEIRSTYGNLGNYKQEVEVLKSASGTTKIPGLTSFVIKPGQEDEYISELKILTDEFHTKRNSQEKEDILTSLYIYLGGNDILGFSREKLPQLIEKMGPMSLGDEMSMFDNAVQAAVFGDYVPLKSFLEHGDGTPYSPKVFRNEPAIMMDNIFKAVGITRGVSLINATLLESYAKAPTGENYAILKHEVEGLVGKYYNEFMRYWEHKSLDEEQSLEISWPDLDETSGLASDEIVDEREPGFNLRDETQVQDIVAWIMDEVLTPIPEAVKTVDTLVYNILQGVDYDMVIGTPFNLGSTTSLVEYDSFLKSNLEIISDEKEFTSIYKSTFADIQTELGTLGQKYAINIQNGNKTLSESSLAAINKYIGNLSYIYNIDFLDKTGLLTGTKTATETKVKNFVEGIMGQIENHNKKHYRRLLELAAAPNRNKVILGEVYNRGYTILPIVKNDIPYNVVYSIDNLLVDLSNLNNNIRISQFSTDTSYYEDQFAAISKKVEVDKKEALDGMTYLTINDLEGLDFEGKQGWVEFFLNTINESLRTANLNRREIERLLTQGQFLPKNLINLYKPRDNNINTYLREAGFLADNLEDVIAGDVETLGEVKRKKDLDTLTDIYSRDEIADFEIAEDPLNIYFDTLDKTEGLLPILEGTKFKGREFQKVNSYYTSDQPGFINLVNSSYGIKTSNIKDDKFRLKLEESLSKNRDSFVDKKAFAEGKFEIDEPRMKAFVVEMIDDFKSKNKFAKDMTNNLSIDC